MTPGKPAAASTVDEYMAALPDAARTTLESLRSAIRSVVPDATEIINYGVPTFRIGRAGKPGKNLVGCGASRSHCSLYLMSSTVLDLFADEVAGYKTSKGTVRFGFGEQLADELVAKLVNARLAEIAAG